MKIVKKNLIPFSLIFLLVLLVVTIIFSVLVGTADIHARDVIKIITNKIFVNKFPIDENMQFIVLNLRMPRIILAILVGSSLALTGCGLQSLFKNPMADPYITGTSSGALFGASLALVLFKDNNLSLAIASFIGSLLSTFVIYNFANKKGKISITTMLLAGLVLSSLLSAIVQIIMIFSKAELINIFTFTMGSFSGATWNGVIIMTIVFFIAFTFYFAHYKELNLISVGDENAESIGVNVNRMKKLFLILSALLTSTTVAFSGVIGFVGLIIPHFFRLIIGNNHKYLIPFSVLGGSIFMLLCDDIARGTLASSEFPVGIITSIIGAPIFLFLLRKSKRLI